MNKGIFHLKNAKPISVSVDKIARAMYLTFSNNPIEKTVRENTSLSIDYGKDGKIVGIEVIRIAATRISKTIKDVLEDTESNLPKNIKKSIEECLHSV